MLIALPDRVCAAAPLKARVEPDTVAKLPLLTRSPYTFRVPPDARLTVAPLFIVTFAAFTLVDTDGLCGAPDVITTESEAVGTIFVFQLDAVVQALLVTPFQVKVHTVMLTAAVGVTAAQPAEAAMV